MTDLSNARTLKTPADLAEGGLIDAAAIPGLSLVADRYAIGLPPHLAALSRHEPAIARQFVPNAAELHATPEERADPIGDEHHSPVKGIVHRYPDRVLFMPTLSCAVYCRFCFRRETVGASGVLSRGEQEAALSYIRSAENVWEVILTGGDPLTLSPARLREIVTALDTIDHVKILRIHTRVPVAAPERIDDALIDVLTASRKTVYVAVHCNHTTELTPAVREACDRLVSAGIPLLAQTVLLRGVNDTVAALDSLFRALVAARIKPYYLHQLDYARGTEHFRVPIDEAMDLVAALRGRLSGLALPTFVIDIPGGAGKVPAQRSYLSPEGDGTFLVRDPKGGNHPYPPRT